MYAKQQQIKLLMAGITLVKRATIYNGIKLIPIIKIKSKPGKWNEFMQFPNAETRDNTLIDLLESEIKYIQVL